MKGADLITPRENYEAFERQFLCEYACLSGETKGRERPVVKCEYRTDFQRDRDKIIHCNSFRRLKHKTQVFLSPTGDHYRTRLTHTLEVGQIARTIARALRLNEDLTEAIAMGHDLGHTPFGHAGERALDALCPDGFRHYEQGVRVVELIEKEGKGLDLTYEVRDGILNHTNSKAHTLEGYVVRFADVIAYINHDIDDSIRGGIIAEQDIPADITDILGHSKSQRITSLVGSIINKGIYIEDGKPTIGMDKEINDAYQKLHRFMFESVYCNPKCKSEESKAQNMLAKLYEYFCDDVKAMPPLYVLLADRFGKERAVCDYISGMTDRYAIDLFSELFIPVEWKVR